MKLLTLRISCQPPLKARDTGVNIHQLTFSLAKIFPPLFFVPRSSARSRVGPALIDDNNIAIKEKDDDPHEEEEANRVEQGRDSSHGHPERVLADIAAAREISHRHFHTLNETYSFTTKFLL